MGSLDILGFRIPSGNAAGIASMEILRLQQNFDPDKGNRNGGEREQFSQDEKKAVRNPLFAGRPTCPHLLPSS
jgi:hypothetical protein